MQPGAFPSVHGSGSVHGSAYGSVRGGFGGHSTIVSHSHSIDCSAMLSLTPTRLSPQTRTGHPTNVVVCNTLAITDSILLTCNAVNTAKPKQALYVSILRIAQQPWQHTTMIGIGSDRGLCVIPSLSTDNQQPKAACQFHWVRVQYSVQYSDTI
jgi:hypothetical protein